MRVFSGLLITAALSSSLLAQEQAGAPMSVKSSIKSFTSKFFLTGALNGAAIKLDGNSSTENGGGATIGVGYGFSPAFAGYMEASGANMSSETGDYTMGHFDIGVRYHFANVARQWIPFLDAAVTGRAVAQDNVTICTTSCSTDNLSMSGGGFTLGGGVMYYASPKLAVSANLKWTSGKFTDVTFGNATVTGLDQKATSSRFGLGVVWFPSAR